MKLSVERNSGSTAVLDITSEDAEYQEALQVAYRKVSKDVQIPGFRKGKAPRQMIERMYGPDVFAREAADELMEKLYREALSQENLVPVGDPQVEIKEFEPLNFVVTVAVYPTVELGDYSGIRVDPIDAAVTDDDVQEVIDRLQRSQSPWVDPKEARTPVDGDQVTVNYAVKDGDTTFQEPIDDAVFVLGETNLLVQLKDQIEKLHVGESATFDIAFDEDDETADASIRGKTLTYTVTLVGLKEREILPLDDEFAKDVADAESMDDLRQQIRDDIHQGKTNDARNDVVNQIVDKLAEVSPLDLPHEMIHEEVHHQMEHLKQDAARNGMPFEAFLASRGQNEQTLHDSLFPESERRLRNSLLLREYATREGVEVTDEDIDAEIDRLVGANGGQASGDDAEAQAERLREIYKSDYFRNMLQSELFDRKLTDHLIDQATEGKGAVVNAWVAPEPVAAATTDSEDADSEAGIVDAEIVSDASEKPAAKAADTASTSKRKTRSAGPTETEGTDWVAAVEGEDAPNGWLVKGNADSGIYHTPESPAYENTVAEVWFPDGEAAERAGYRAPKNMPKSGEAAADVAKSAAKAASDES
ncbi:MAG: trigger factor [Thermomicrobiales bacterium]